MLASTIVLIINAAIIIAVIIIIAKIMSYIKLKTQYYREKLALKDLKALQQEILEENTNLKEQLQEIICKME